MSTLLDGYHLALHLPASELGALGAGLERLGPEAPAALWLGATPARTDAVALLGFASAGAATAHLPALRRLGKQLGALVVDLGGCDAGARAKLVTLAEGHELKEAARTPVASALQTLKGLLEAEPVVLEFPDLEALYFAFARAIAEGGLWVAGAPRGQATRFRVTFAVGEDRLVGNLGVLLTQHAPAQGRGLGYWLDVTPSPTLKGLLNRRARERRKGQPAGEPPPGVMRRAPRYETLLEVRLGDLPAMADQWATDISHGGMFIKCAQPPELRSRVTVHLQLPDGEELSLPAEVVHRILSGTGPGVGVQFVDPDPAAVARLESLLGEYQRRRPRVLVVDDEAIWRSTLARALTALGVEVQLACDGHEGLLKLIDGYFDLDLVILDLHMPNLDGGGLIQRIRRLGGDQGLKVFLFSAAGPEELASLDRPGLATGVFSKLDSIDALTARIASELGLPPPGLPAAA